MAALFRGEHLKHHLDGKVFRSVSNSENGEVGPETLFYYHQRGALVWAEYRGGSVVQGQLLAQMDGEGCLDMRYHHLNQNGEFMLGQCRSVPSVLPDGRLRFTETWQWLSGNGSAGTSVIEELVAQ